MNKKLLLSLSTSALILCLSMPSAHGMDGNQNEEKKPVGAKRKRLQDTDLQATESESNFSQVGFSLEIYEKIMLKAQVDIRTVLSWRTVCKEWDGLIDYQLWDNSGITDETAKNKTYRLTLNALDNRNLTDEGLKLLTNLTDLTVGDGDTYDDGISDEGLKKLTNLTRLHLLENCTDYVTDETIGALTNLTDLNIGMNKKITDSALQKLSKLIKFKTAVDKDDLDRRNKKITNMGLCSLTTLTTLKLNMWENIGITGEICLSLPNLTSLTLSGNGTITNMGIALLTNLRTLKLKGNAVEEYNFRKRRISDTGIQELTNLTRLTLNWCRFDSISGSLIKRLPNLTKLNLKGANSIKWDHLKDLTQLINLPILQKQCAEQQRIKITEAFRKYMNAQNEAYRFISSARKELCDLSKEIPEQLAEEDLYNAMVIEKCFIDSKRFKEKTPSMDF